MANLNLRIYYRRNLPHYQFDHTVFFITFKLANNFPLNIIAKLEKDKTDYDLMLEKIDDKDRAEYSRLYFKNRFLYIDEILNKHSDNENYLAIDSIAQKVYDTILYFNQKKYDVICFCIMPNHVHLVINLLNKNNKEMYSLAEVMHSIKGYTANECNKILNKTGQFWHHESYDHTIRNYDDLNYCINYTLENPVKAKLVEDWIDWRFSYLAKDFGDKL